MICRKCETEMVLGIATAQTYVGGMPDFEGETHSSTFSAGGTGKVIPCHKCPSCGHSVTQTLNDMLADAVEAYKNMTPKEKDAVIKEQKESYVRAEFGLKD